MNSLYPHCRVCRTFRTTVSVPVLAQSKRPIYYFSFCRWVVGRSFPFSKASLAWGGWKQGLGEEYYPRMRVEIVPLTV